MSGKKDTGPLVIGGEPRIDFLPLEIKQRKEAKRSRRSLIALVILVLVICVGGYVYSAANALQAQVNLAMEQARTQELLQAQTEYAEARTVTTDIDSAKAAALVGSSTEILWKPYLKSLEGVMPDDSEVVSFTIDSQNALELAPEVTVPLEQSRVATLTFSVATTSIARADQLTVNIKELPGFADAITTTIAGEEDVYLVDVILHINDSVFERRLFEVKDPDAEAETTTDDTEAGN